MLIRAYIISPKDFFAVAFIDIDVSASQSVRVNLKKFWGSNLEGIQHLRFMLVLNVVGFVII